jgi:hypothetical protein
MLIPLPRSLQFVMCIIIKRNTTGDILYTRNDNWCRCEALRSHERARVIYRRRKKEPSIVRSSVKNLSLLHFFKCFTVYGKESKRLLLLIQGGITQVVPYTATIALQTS